MKKQIMLLFSLVFMSGLRAMEECPEPMDIEQGPEWRRVAPRAQDVLLLQLLRNKENDAAYDLLNTGIQVSGSVIDELNKDSRWYLFYMKALGNQHPNIINALIEAKFLTKDRLDKDFRSWVAYLRGGGSMSPNPHNALITLLKSNGARLIDLNQKSGAIIPLFRAIDLKDIQIVEALLRAGANPNIKDERGVTPLLSLVRSGWDAYGSDDNDKKVKIIRLLRAAKADASFRDENGNTLLMMAVSFKATIPFINGLLAFKPDIDINAQNNYGETALMLALTRGNIDAIELLLTYPRTNLLLQDRDGHNALWFARDSRNGNVRAYIPQLEAKMRQQIEKK